MRTCIHLLLFLSCGIALRLSAPPLNIPFIFFIALTAAIWKARDNNGRMSFAGGCILGGIWNSPLILGASNWGALLTCVPWFIAAALTGLFFLAINISWSRLPKSAFALFISLAWLGLVYLANLLQYPLTFSATLAFSNPWFIHTFSSLGFYGLELLIILCSCMPIIFFNADHMISTITTLILFFTSSLPLTNKQPDEKIITIAAIQPSIEHSSFLATSWSLHERKEIEDKVDALTIRGLAIKPDIVVWPEGANGLDNFNIPRRISQTHQFRSSGRSELLLTGYEYDEDNNKFNSAVLISPNGQSQSARKTQLAPIAESNLRKGSPAVLHSSHGNLGIAICFDALFNAHFEALTKMKSDFFFIVTDDSSLARTNLPYIHASYVILFSAIYKKPAVFVNNNGVSFATGSRGEILDIDYSGRLPQVYSWRIASNIESPGWLALHQYVYFAILALLVVGLTRKHL